MRRMPGSVYTLPVPAILSSQVLNTKNQRNVYLQKKIMIRMMPKNMIMQMTIITPFWLTKNRDDSYWHCTIF